MHTFSPNTVRSILLWLWPSVLGVCGVSLLTTCKHEADAGPDPCAGVTSRPTFRMLNQIGAAAFECDSMLPGTVLFEAPQGYSAYDWTITGDPRHYATPRFSLEFELPTQVQVQLVAHRTPSPACVPGDKGIDTFYKSLTIVPASSGIPHTAIEGKYRGVTLDAPSDSFTIQIRRGPDPFIPAQESMQLLNVNKGCQPPAIPVRVTYGYQGFAFFQNYPGYPTNGCKLVIGSGALDMADHQKIRLEYTEQDKSSTPRSNKVFVGKRTR